mmetsp:Transcript_26606/g.70760  ORF Transcript_26606/g.70760 Transcript_26606/m.70760 type:complete len:204 (+) Transcript_26606:904-1515(+)
MGLLLGNAGSPQTTAELGALGARGLRRPSHRPALCRAAASHYLDRGGYRRRRAARMQTRLPRRLPASARRDHLALAHPHGPGVGLRRQGTVHRRLRQRSCASLAAGGSFERPDLHHRRWSQKQRHPRRRVQRRALREAVPAGGASAGQRQALLIHLGLRGSQGAARGLDEARCRARDHDSRWVRSATGTLRVHVAFPARLGTR